MLLSRHLREDALKTVTMEDVARDAGVSRALVSIAFRGVSGVSAATREKIFASADRLGYRPNRIAASLASKAQDTLGVMLQDLRNDLFADIFDGIRDEADAAGKHVVLTVGSVDGTRDEDVLDTLLQSRVDTVIAAGLVLPDNDATTFAQRIPVVSVARKIPGVASVYSDNVAGATMATRHLIGLGHRRIAFLANPQTDGYLGRRLGYDDTMRGAGLTPLVMPSSYARDVAARDAAALLRSADAPTAVFAHNDQAALGVLDAAFSLGISVPRELSVVGYDNSAMSRAPGTALTTVDIDGHELGRRAASLALRQLEGDVNASGRSVVRIPELIVRETTAAHAS